MGDYWKFIDTVFIAPVKEHFVFAIALLGVLSYVAGTSGLAIWRGHDYSEHLVRGGATIFGAGVCAAIMKSRQFLTIFQENLHRMLCEPDGKFGRYLRDNIMDILYGPDGKFGQYLRDNMMDVVYGPPRAADHAQLQQKWAALTQNLLSSLLSEHSPTATAALVASMLERRRSFYYSDLRSRYRMEIRGDVLTITSTVEANLHIAPDCDNFMLKQATESDTTPELLSFMLDNREVSPQRELTDRNGVPGKKLSIQVDLADHLQPGQKMLRLSRVTRTQQSLRAEPFITANLSRFTNGAVITAKIAPEYMVRVIANGIELPDPKPGTDADGYVRWNLANPNVLLLPGQGYTLIIIKVKRGLNHVH